MLNSTQIKNIFLKGWRPYFWIALVIFAVYAQTLVFDLVLFDDDVFLVNHYNFLSNWSNVFKIFNENVFRLSFGGSYYRPLLTLSLMFDAGLVAKGSLVLYHFSNIVYHIIAVSLFFLLLLKLQYKRLLSFLAALIFAVHPVFTQAVAWIPGRNDTLLAIFVLASFIFFLKYLETKPFITDTTLQSPTNSGRSDLPLIVSRFTGKDIRFLQYFGGRTSYFFLHLLFFIFALLTKETAIVLPIVLLFYLLVIYKEKFFSFNQKILIPSWILITGIWFFIRQSIVGGFGYSLIELLKQSIVNLKAVINFVGKLILPFDLSTYPTLQDMTMVYGILAIGILTILLVFTAKKRWGYISFGLLWFFAFLLPTFISLDLGRPAFFLEHRVYVPAFGFFIFLLEIRKNGFLENIKIKRQYFVAGGIFLILIFSVLTMRNSMNYRSGIEYWEKAVKTSPNSLIAHTNLGMVYYLTNRIDEAEKEFKKVLELDPKKPFILNNIGIIYMRKKMFKEAEKEFKKDLEINPYNANAYYNLGLIYYQQDKIKEAEKWWLKTIKIEPNYSKAYNRLAIYYFNKKDTDKAAYYIGQIFDRGLKVGSQLSKLLDTLNKARETAN